MNIQINVQEFLERNRNRMNDADYVAALEETVRKQRALLDKGLTVEETFEILGDVQVELFNRFHYGFPFVTKDTVDFGLLIR